MTPRTSMLIVSYERDFPWLEYLYRSIERHVNGFHEIVLALPEQDEKPYKKMYGKRKWKFDCPLRVVYFEEGELDPHIAALYCRCCADEITTGDFVLNVDSDCVFIAPTDPEIYFDLTFGAKPILLYAQFEVRDGKPWPSHWGPCTSEALGFTVEYEVMRRHPAVHYRSLYPKFRSHVESVHSKSFYDYLIGRKRSGLNAPTFSEFTSLGAYAWYYMHNRYLWILDGPQRPADHVHQFWSFFGVQNKEVQAKLKELDLL